MGYPIDLDEYTDRQITQEYLRRQKCKEEGECSYCGRQLDDSKSCKIKAHRIVRLQN